MRGFMTKDMVAIVKRFVVPAVIIALLVFGVRNTYFYRASFRPWLLQSISDLTYTEARGWRMACADNTRDVYLEYLSRHPNGRHSESARAWLALDTARTSATMDAYETVIRDHPNTEEAIKAKARIQAIQKRDSSLAGISHMAIVIEDETAGIINRAVPFLPFKSLAAEAIYDRGGFGYSSATEPNSSTAVLRVKCEVKALSGFYVPEISGKTGEYRTTGASVSGDVALEVSTGTLWRSYFLGKISTPNRIAENGYRSDREAPYESAFWEKGSYPSSIMAMESNLFHTVVLQSKRRGQSQ